MQKLSAGKFHSALPEMRRRSAFRHHSGLMLAARITLPHFSVSSAMSFPNSVGDHWHRHIRKVGKPRLHLGIGKACSDLRVELVDDLGRRALARRRRTKRFSRSREQTRLRSEGPAALPSAIALLTARPRSLPALMYSTDEATEGTGPALVHRAWL